MDPAGTVTFRGTDRNLLLSFTWTLMLAGEAAASNVTVQVLEPREGTDDGLQPSEEISRAGVMDKVAVWVLPLKTAVTVADWVVVTVPAVAVKLAELAPLGKVTLMGTDRAALLLESAAAPVVGVGPLRVTVQLEDDPETSDVGLHVTEVIVMPETAVIVPPVAVIGRGCPAGEAATGLVMPMEVELVEAARVTLIVATAPL